MRPEAVRERRFALLIASYEYEDSGLKQLAAPPRDAQGLERVLNDPKIGGFESVRLLVNRPSPEVAVAINTFFVEEDRRRDDLLLLYFSGHGIKNEDGQLFLACSNTNLRTLDATAVPSQFIHGLMNRRRSRRQVLVLDCCFSGAFPQGFDPKGEARALGGQYFQGQGRVVLMASDALQYAFEGPEVRKEDGESAVWSQFTHKLVEGLETGQADLKKDGYVSVREWYDYACERLAAEQSPQRPQIWEDAEGDIIVATAVPRDLPFEKGKGTSLPDRFGVLQDTRWPVFDLIGPAYLLDRTYHLLDWNPAFDELVAKPLGLTRGRHVGAFIRGLNDCTEVIERSKRLFGGEGPPPLIDMEPLVFNSPTYGAIRFHKVAAQIPDNSGSTLAWCVSLNILGAEHLDRLWQDVSARVEHELNWATYAVSYDRLLLAFPEYLELVQFVVAQVGDRRHCIDLGAGTGNGSLELLKNPEREVWAVEANETMLRHFRAKVRALQDGPAYSRRLTLIKDDILRLDGFPSNAFDAAVLINVLYAVDDRERCLRQVYRILKPGGVVALSTPHQKTDVDRLFERMKAVLIEQGLFEELEPNWRSARDRHRALDKLIHRDTKEAICRYLESSGFTIANKDWRQDCYVGAVIVVKAVKPAVPPAKKRKTKVKQ